MFQGRICGSVPKLKLNLSEYERVFLCICLRNRQCLHFVAL